MREVAKFSAGLPTRSQTNLMSVPDVVVVEGSKRSPARSASTSDFRYGLPCGLREFGRVRPVMLGPPAGGGGVAMAATAAKKQEQ